MRFVGSLLATTFALAAAAIVFSPVAAAEALCGNGSGGIDNYDSRYLSYANTDYAYWGTERQGGGAGGHYYATRQDGAGTATFSQYISGGAYDVLFPSENYRRTVLHYREGGFSNWWMEQRAFDGTC